MNIIQKDQIYPILISTTQYEDKYGNQNSYVEMNPTLFIEKDGSYTILVRTVNYRKYKDKSFTVYGNVSNTEYKILRGKIQGDSFEMDKVSISSMNVQYNIPQTFSLWYGVEDIRFVSKDTVLACIPECNNSVPCIFQGKLYNNILTEFVKCEPSGPEKNWMPFEWKSRQSVIYSLSPFIIKDILTTTQETQLLSSEKQYHLEGWHGSSNGIPFYGGILFLIHKNEERVYNRWLYYNPETQEIQLSNKFVFFRDSYLEFTCSLSEYEKMFYVGLGVNDSQAYIIKLHESSIFEFFDFNVVRKIVEYETSTERV